MPLPAVPGFFRRHPWRVLALAIVLALAALLLPRLLLGPQVSAYRVVRTDLLQTVVASGRVETPLRVDVGSQLTGTVAEVAVAQGQTVRRGQLLFRLEDSEQQAALAQARAGVAQAQARLAQLERLGLPSARQAVAQAQTNFDNARRAYERARELRERNFVGQAALDDARRSMDIARSQLATARLQEQSQAGGGADRQLAQAALAQAQATEKAAQARLDMTRVTAPHDGVLIARAVERGDVVQPGKVLLVLSPAGATQLVLQIDERNLAHLALGQKALASADAFPGQRFEARVAYINPGVDAQRGSVEVRLDVPAPPPYLKQDMTVSVDIEVGQRRQVLAVPAVTLREDARGTWAMKVEQGRTQRQDLRLGLRGTGQVEVLQGLREGELVLPATSPIAPGERVRAGTDQ